MPRRNRRLPEIITPLEICPEIPGATPTEINVGLRPVPRTMPLPTAAPVGKPTPRDHPSTPPRGDAQPVDGPMSVLACGGDTYATAA